MKRPRRRILLLSLILAACLALAGVCPAYALEDAPMRTVRVGFYHSGGYHVMDENGNRSGYGYDILQAMKLYNNWTYEYVGYDKGWADIQQMILDGQVDLVVSAVKTPARMEIYDFSERPIGQSGACLMVKAGESHYVAGQYDSYNGMRIGFIENNAQIASTEAFAEANGFTYTPVYYKTSSELEAAILSGTEVDAIVTSNMRIVAGTRRLELFAMQNIHVMVQKGNSELLAEVNYALEQISLYNPTLYDSLFNKYYSVDSGDQVFFSPEESRFIAGCQAQGEVLRVALTPELSPYAYYENGQPAGILYDIAAEILRRTGLQTELIVTESNTEYQELIDDRSIDLRLAARFDYNYAEMMGYTLTDPYYTTDVSRVTRKDLDGAIQTVAVVRNSPIDTHYLPTVANGETIIRYDTLQECLSALLNGDCDALYLFTRTAQQVVYEDETNRLTSVIMPRYSAGFSIAVRDNADARLASIVEKATASLSEDDIAGMVLKYTDHAAQPITLRGLIYNNPLLILVLVVVLLILIFAGVMVGFISRKRRQEQEQNLQLQDALMAARSANSAKSMFMSRMSHEIRTPLNAIIGYNSMSYTALSAAQSAEQYQQATAQALDCLNKGDIASRHLLTVINDVLDMSAIESGKIKMEQEAFDLHGIIAAFNAIFSSQATTKGVDFEVRVDESVPQWLVGDQMRINQIFTNLLSNALKFTPPGGSVMMSVTWEDGLRAVIKDSGIGMSEEFLDHIWTPFEQADASISRRFGGTGLGLSITKSLVDLMQGSISVESQPEQGSTFTVSLPLAAAPQPLMGETAEAAANSRVDLSGLRLLLAEDNKMNMEITKALLSSWQVQADSAWNGRQAVDMFCSAPAATYDAILMDVHMPELDGYRATQEIRNSGHSDARSIPIIAMTADVFAEDVAEALAAGMNSHIGKPINKTLLQETLNRFCQ